MHATEPTVDTSTSSSATDSTLPDDRGNFSIPTDVLLQHSPSLVSSSKVSYFASALLR